MSAPSSIKELAYRLEKAKQREQFKLNQRLASPTPYKGKPDRTRLYYRDWQNGGLYVAVDINTASLAKVGGAANIGLYDEAAFGAIAGNPTAIPNRNIRVPMVLMKWFKGDAIPTVRTTGWGTRIVDFADRVGDIKFNQVYFSSRAATITLDALVENFDTFWTPQRITDLLGVKGRAQLLLGKEVLDSRKQ